MGIIHLARKWTPSVLFSASEQGVWYDPSDFSTMFQDSAGTTPVTAVEQNVGLVLDKSGNGNHASQSSSGSRPVLRARYNLLTYSEQFDNAAWASKVGITVYQDTTDTTDPLGGNTAEKILETAAGGGHYIGQTVAVTNGASYTYSQRLKYLGRQWALLTVYDGANHETYFDIQNGVVGNTPAGTVASITDLGDGWYLCTATRTVAASSIVVYVQWAASNGGTASFVGDITKGIYIWGADLRVTNDGVGLPAYQRIAAATDYDTTGFPPYLLFDGSDDSLATAAIDFSATDEMSVFAGVREITNGGSIDARMIAELSAAVGSNAGSWALYRNGTAGYGFNSRGSAAVVQNNVTTGYAFPITNVVTGLSDISGDLATLRANGSQVVQSTSDQGTGNYGAAHPLYIGSRAGSSLRFNGRLYSLAVVGRATTASEIESMEAWVNSKTGAY
jgi:hypothetical protein